jgi:hypothetical protein
MFSYAAIDLHSGLVALSDLYSFSVNQSDGSLVQLQAPETFGGSTPLLASDPMGHALYATVPRPFPNRGCGGVRTWSINANTGSLTRGPDGSPCFAAEISFTPTGKYAYISGSDYSGRLGIYASQISADTGNLTDVPGSPFAVGCTFGAMEPTQGKFLFCPLAQSSVASQIATLAVDAATGALSPMPGVGVALPGAYAQKMLIVDAGH